MDDILYMSGHFMGYSQISHSVSEFCVMNCLQLGVSKIMAIVLKWCDSSYLEEQNKFRISGGFSEMPSYWREKVQYL